MSGNIDNNRENVICDGDWGGDEMQMLAVLLAHPNIAKIQCVTSVFGNTTHEHVLKNAGRILKLFNEDQNITRYAGHMGPLGEPVLEGDGAHGDDGIGGIKLDESVVSADETHSCDAILSLLSKAPQGTITITATGPQTNLAHAVQKDISTMKRVKAINIMGGCTDSIPAHDMPTRQGNITPYGEFNFYMAPKDADAVLNSGLPINLFPMNCTQQLSFTDKYREKLMAAFENAPKIGQLLSDLISVPAALDKNKFNSAPTMHDVHTGLYIVRPDLYEGRRGFVSVEMEGEKRGLSTFTPDDNGNVSVLETLKDVDALFDVVLDSFKAIFQDQLKA